MHGRLWWAGSVTGASRGRGAGPLAGQVALVAGATRGASRAVALEPETVEDLHDELQGLGDGRALRVDHLDPGQVRALVADLEREHGRLDLLVVGLFGADLLTTFGTSLWEHDLDRGLPADVTGYR